MNQKVLFLIIGGIIGVLIGAFMATQKADQETLATDTTIQEKVEQIAKKASYFSPLYTISKIERNAFPDKPLLITTIGKDKSEKELCVFFLAMKDEPMTYVYFDQGISQEEALEKAHEYLGGPIEPQAVKLEWFGGPIFWDIHYLVEGSPANILIDFRTGEQYFSN